MTFTQLGLIKPLIQATEEQGYETPSPIQQQAIPAILAGKDVLASAQTGTGKTASFVLPLLQKLNTQPKAGGNQALVLIITPTRELAAQVHESIINYGRFLTLRSTVVFGGVKINPQMMRLRSGVELLVATPGRLLDLHQNRAIRLDNIQTLVLDEADRMLDMGFIHDIKRIIKLLPHKRQNLLFSATFSESMRSFIKELMHNPVEIDVAPRNTAVVKIKQTIHPVDKGLKAQLLSHLVHTNKLGQTIVFTKTKHGANKLVKQLEQERIHAAAIHGNKSQSQRTKTLAAFKSGELHLLIATDIAARGLDIEQLPCVINFDLPQVAEDYVHRIGRTGRAGASGLALSLVSADEANQLQAIERLIKQKLPRVEVDGFEPQHHVPVSKTLVKPAKKYNSTQGKSARDTKTTRPMKPARHSTSRPQTKNQKRESR